MTVTLENLRKYQKELMATLNANDLELFKAFWHKWDIEKPDDDFIYEITMHKVRVHTTRVYPKLRKESKKWLLEHNFKLTIG